MKRLLLLSIAAVLLAGSAGADVVDNVVVGNTAFGLVELDPSLGLLGKLGVETTTRALGTPDGNFVTVDASQNLNIWNGETRAWINGVATTAGACSMAVDRNTGRIAVGATDGSVKIYNSSLTQIGSQAGFGGVITDIVFQESGDVVLSTPTKVWMLNSAFDTIVRSQSGFSSVTSLAVQSGDKILVGDSVLSGGKVWQFSSDLIDILHNEQGYGAVSDIAVQSDDSFVIATTTKLWRRTVDFDVAGSATGFSNVTALAIQSDDDVVIGDSGIGRVSIYTPNLVGNTYLQNGFGTVNNLGVLYMVPEPVTMCILAFGGVFLARRKMKM